MGITAAKGLTAKEAVTSAFDHFREFFSGDEIKNVLLEQLDYESEADQWRVMIGFDVGRKAFARPGTNALALMYDERITPVREKRVFVLRGVDGALERIED